MIHNCLPDQDCADRDDGFKAPERIYLQIGESEVSWCGDQINDCDVEYVRADAARQPLGKED